MIAGKRRGEECEQVSARVPLKRRTCGSDQSGMESATQLDRRKWRWWWCQPAARTRGVALPQGLLLVRWARRRYRTTTTRLPASCASACWRCYSGRGNADQQLAANRTTEDRMRALSRYARLMVTRRMHLLLRSRRRYASYALAWQVRFLGRRPSAIPARRRNPWVGACSSRMPLARS